MRLFKVCKDTVAIATQQAIHRGWPLSQGVRDALVNYYIEHLPARTLGYHVNHQLGYHYTRGEERAA